MENRIAVIAIIVEDISMASSVNNILHEYGKHIIGRMGLPCRERNISIISVVIDAHSDTISALSGKIGRLNGVSAKAVYSKN